MGYGDLSPVIVRGVPAAPPHKRVSPAIRLLAPRPVHIAPATHKAVLTAKQQVWLNGAMKTTLYFPDDLLAEVKHEAIRQHRTLKDLMADLVRLGMAAQQQAPTPARRKEVAEAWLSEWQSLGTTITSKAAPRESLVASLEVDRASRG